MKQKWTETGYFTWIRDDGAYLITQHPTTFKYYCVYRLGQDGQFITDADDLALSDDPQYLMDIMADVSAQGDDAERYADVVSEFTRSLSEDAYKASMMIGASSDAELRQAVTGAEIVICWDIVSSIPIVLMGWDVISSITDPMDFRPARGFIASEANDWRRLVRTVERVQGKTDIERTMTIFRMMNFEGAV